jgi:hypothetical protein
MVAPPDTRIPLAADPRASHRRQCGLAVDAVHVVDQIALDVHVCDGPQADVVEVGPAAVAAHPVVPEVALLVGVGVGVGTRSAGVRGQGGELGFVVGVEFGELGEELLYGAVECYRGAAGGDGDGPGLLEEGVAWERRFHVVGGCERGGSENGEEGGESGNHFGLGDNRLFGCSRMSVVRR